jgi:Holliday junction resolvasome RuvABC DNA-binding subunit
VERQIHLRQRRSVLDTARRALVNMGFREREVKRALLRLPDVEATPPIQDVLKSALALLSG